MNTSILSELMAQRDAIDNRITNHKPLPRSAAIKKVRDYAAEFGMTEDDLFPIPIDPNADPFTDDEPWPDPNYIPFPEFVYPDTFGYTFIADLMEQRDELDSKIYAIRHEAIERARAFIREYNLTKEDIAPTAHRAK